MTPTPETRPTRAGASTGGRLPAFVLASTLCCWAAGEAYAVTGPLYVTDSFRWTSSAVWKAEGHVVAVELNDAQLQLLSTRPQYALGHKHYQSVTTTVPTLGGVEKPVVLEGDPTERLARINKAYFGINSPSVPPGTLGTNVVLKHDGRGFDPNSPECYGGVLSNGHTGEPWSQTINWPSQCGTTPPPNQACVVTLEGGGVVDLGAVSPGTVKTAEVNGVVSCTAKGKVDLMVTHHQNNGIAEGKLLKSSVVDADGARPLPSDVRVDAGAAKNVRLKFDLKYSGAGAATTAIFVTWTPS